MQMAATAGACAVNHARNALADGLDFSDGFVRFYLHRKNTPWSAFKGRYKESVGF